MDRRNRRRSEGQTGAGWTRSRGNMRRNRASFTRILAVALMLVAGLLLAAALPAQGQTRTTQSVNPAPAATRGGVAHVMSKPVVRVNGTVLTDVDLLREMYAIFPYAKQHNGAFPRAMEADIRRGALKMIEFEELVYQEAKRRNMTIAPDRLSKAEKQFRSHFSSQQEYQQVLQIEANGSPAAMRKKIARSLLIEDLLQAEVTNKAVVTLAEARTFFAKNPEQFKLAESYALQTITIMPPVRPSREQPNPRPPTSSELKQMYARAQEVLRKAQAAKSYEEFGLLAEKISEDDYRVMMGDHHKVNASDLPAEILDAASKLQPGQISGIVQAESAYTIIRLNGHFPARMQKFSEVQNSLRAQLTQQKTDRLRRGLDAKLRKDARIEEL